ncbi:unnamed protein product [Mycena citricolor]|uniref:Natural resistance-associated macrophage protein n=1 Tax=Mycena citricolor TaxID=2018698 RepID=A0AAD2Q6B8_9AGAR|nr:unnamed protein product [Mycena citricolor]
MHLGLNHSRSPSTHMATNMTDTEGQHRLPLPRSETRSETQPSALSVSTSMTKPPFHARLKRVGSTVALHARKHAGVGVICAVAYFDPGNWGVDLQAGSELGFKLLTVVLFAGLFAAFLQVLATRLGCVTGLDLASHCRVLLYNRPKHTRLYRWLGLYPLYLLSEIAIISTDLAELLGSAIALCLLFPRLQLWHAVLITAFDVVLLLALRDPLRSSPVKMFEYLIAAMVLAVMVCLVIIIVKVDVDWDDAFLGFVPSKYLFTSNGLYLAVGILGATVMPHSLFLGSALAVQDRVGTPLEMREEPPPFNLWLKIKLLFRTPPASTLAKPQHENNTLTFVRNHLAHQTFDVVGSLLGFAVLINSMILILAATMFYYGGAQSSNSASLFDAYDLISRVVGKPAATLFAISLLAAGQSSSIIATVAGQVVSEGFLQWRVSPVVRRLLTRLIAVVPATVVAVVVGRPGVDTLLVASQVILAIVLPFITFPLIFLTSSKSTMLVRREHSDPTQTAVDYSNNLPVTLLGWTIWLIIVAANVYVIVTLFIAP